MSKMASDTSDNTRRVLRIPKADNLLLRLGILPAHATARWFYQPSIKSFLPNIIGYQYPRLATSSNLPTILKLVSRATMKEKRSGYHQSDVGSTSDLSCIMKSEFWCGKKVSGAASSSACNTTGELTRTWNYSANISSVSMPHFSKFTYVLPHSSYWPEDAPSPCIDNVQNLVLLIHCSCSIRCQRHQHNPLDKPKRSRFDIVPVTKYLISLCQQLPIP